MVELLRDVYWLLFGSLDMLAQQGFLRLPWPASLTLPPEVVPWSSGCVLKSCDSYSAPFYRSVSIPSLHVFAHSVLAGSGAPFHPLRKSLDVWLPIWPGSLVT